MIQQHNEPAVVRTDDPVDAAVEALDAAVRELRKALADRKLRDAQEGTT